VVEQNKVTITVTPEEANLIKELRSFYHGQAVIIKVQGKLDSVELIREKRKL
jgi:hypothetical protein